MISALESLTKVELQALPRKGLEDLAWQEKEVITLLKSELLEATLTNQALQDKSAHIEDLLERFKKILFGKSSEKSSSPERPKPLNRLNRPEPAIPHSKLPSERYPHVEVLNKELVLSGPLECHHCGHEMEDSGLREVTEQLTCIPKRFQIIRYHKPKYHCCHCHSGLLTLNQPRIRPGSAFSDDMILDVTLSKYNDLIPMERYCEMAARDGVVGLAPHSLIELTHCLADFLEGVVDLIRKAVLAAKVLMADETPHRMLEGDEKSNWFLWGFCDSRHSYFEIHPTRSGDVASQLLIQSQCHTLLSDAYGGYNKAIQMANTSRPTENPITGAYCNAHARRRFLEAQKNFPNEADFYLETYKNIYAKEKESKTLSQEGKKEARLAMAPLFERMRQQGQKDLSNVPLKSSLAKAIMYFQDNYEGLTQCLKDPEIPLDNNLQERLLRRPVIGRKTWYGTHSKRGAQTAAKLFTIIQSCRLCHVNPREYLKAVVKAIHGRDPPFTPWEYSQLVSQTTSTP